MTKKGIKNLIYFFLLVVSLVLMLTAMFLKDPLFFSVAVLCLAGSYVMLTEKNN